jgi:hypothetical protein
MYVTSSTAIAYRYCIRQAAQHLSVFQKFNITSRMDMLDPQRWWEEFICIWEDPCIMHPTPWGQCFSRRYMTNIAAHLNQTDDGDLM